MSLARTLRTLRYLKPSQVLWRVRYAAERRLNLRRGTDGRRWSWMAAEPPAIQDDFPELPPTHLGGPRGPAVVERLAAGTFEHLGRVKELGFKRPDWCLGTPPTDRLWTITLHYHEWAYALAEVATTPSAKCSGKLRRRAASLFRHYVADWIRHCAIERPGSSALAWNSYAIASRMGWWIRAHRAARGEIFGFHADFEDLFLRSLWQQAAYLGDHLEWDLRANHLMRDLVGLALAGRFFAHPRARDWLRRAGNLALEQIGEQVLADGGSFERSPKYHLDVMEDILLLALLTRESSTRDASSRSWAGMAEWISWMRHPDGATAHFNDGAVISAEAVERHLRAGERLGIRVDPRPRTHGRFLAETGLVVWHGDPWTVFFDVGPFGPDEQPGHAHADILSLECSWRGQRLVVDPGCFSYDADPRRRYDRGTQAHNTVSVDGRDSSEIWHVFRAGRRARPRNVKIRLGEEELVANASHDGYDHLPGRPRHSRILSLRDRGTILRLDDDVDGTGNHQLQGGLLIEPDWDVRPIDRGWKAVRAGHGEVSIFLESRDSVERILERRWYHPDYGAERQATWVGWRWQGPLPFHLRWELAGADSLRWRCEQAAWVNRRVRSVEARISRVG